MASAPVILRGNHSHLYGSAMLPVLEELFRWELSQHPSKREALFQIKKTDRDIYQSSELADLPMFSQMAEGEDYSYQKPRQGASKTVSISKFGLGFSISEEAIDDGKIDLVADQVRKMAKSARESQEIQAMDVFNNGFSAQTTADGVAVFSASHTNPSGSTFRNILSSPADLSQAALDAVLSDFDTEFIGDTGIIYQMKPKVLLVHPDSKRYAMELVGSELKPDTADNNLNSMKSDGLQVMSSPHLTDADAWFVLADKADTGLRIISRKGIETKSNEVFDNDSIRYKSRYREAVCVLNAMGIFGTSGGA